MCECSIAAVNDRLWRRCVTIKVKHKLTRAHEPNPVGDALLQLPYTQEIQLESAWAGGYSDEGNTKALHSCLCPVECVWVCVKHRRGKKLTLHVTSGSVMWLMRHWHPKLWWSAQEYPDDCEQLMVRYDCSTACREWKVTSAQSKRNTRVKKFRGT